MYRSVRPACDAKLFPDALEDGATDPELLARLHHGEVEVTRDIMPPQLACSLPLQIEINYVTRLSHFTLRLTTYIYIYIYIYYA
jgi:hypothetical protein